MSRPTAAEVECGCGSCGQSFTRRGRQKYASSCPNRPSDDGASRWLQRKEREMLTKPPGTAQRHVPSDPFRVSRTVCNTCFDLPHARPIEGCPPRTVSVKGRLMTCGLPHGEGK